MRSYHLGLALACVSVFILPVFSSAQDKDHSLEDPFGSNIKSPFGLAPNKPVAKTGQKSEAEQYRMIRDQSDLGVKHQQLQKENVKLKHGLEFQKNVLNKLEAEMTQAMQDRAELVKRIKQIEQEVVDNKTRSEFRDKAYTAFLAQLLASDDPTVQLTALENMKDTKNQAVLAGVSYTASSFAIWEQLDKLLDSENKTVRARAVNTMLTIMPSRALERGFQPMPAGYWRPLSPASAEVAQIRAAFQEPCNFHYEDVPLSEFVEDIQRHYGISLKVDESIDPNKPISLKVQGQIVASGLDVLAKKLGLVVAIVEDGLWLLPPDDLGTRNTQTYNVRGLLSEDISLKQLAELVSDQIDKKDSKIFQIGKYQLVAKATETEQRKISKILGTLSNRE